MNKQSSEMKTLKENHFITQTHNFVILSISVLNLNEWTREQINVQSLSYFSTSNELKSTVLTSKRKQTFWFSSFVINIKHEINFLLLHRCNKKLQSSLG